MTFARALSLASLGTTIALAACGGDTTGTGGQTTSTTTNHVCAADSGATTYSAGMSAGAADGKVTVTVVEANPAPPSKGGNSFVIDVTDDAGKPISGAQIQVTSYMPAHGHYATLVPVVKAGSQPGRYDISNVELFMIGLWQITFTVTPSGAAAEPVMFSFCVEG